MHLNASASDSRDFWRRTLGPVIDDAGLPLARGRSPRPGEAWATLPITIDGPLFTRLLEVSGGGDFLLYAVLVAALKVCLRRHTGARRIAVGSPLRREQVAVAARTLPIVDEVPGGASFRDLLVAVRQTLLDAYSHQRVDPITLLAELGRVAPENRHPFFDVVVRLDALHGPIGAGRHDLELDLQRGELGLSGALRYRPALWDAAAMTAFHARFAATLEQLLADLTRPIRDLDGLPVAERDALLADAHGPPRPHGDAGLHDRILARAAAQPDAPAVLLVGDDGWTVARSYAELADHARRLATVLRAAGVGPGQVVGVAQRRRPALLEGLLAVLITGAAYLPLDPDGPPARVEAMLRRAGVRVLLTDETDERAEPWPAGLVVLHPAAAADAPPIADAPQVGGEHTAYVLFTSGSTGAPKGVAVPHRALANYLEWAVDAYPFAPGRPVPLHGNLDVDLSVTSLWAPLLAGCPVLLVPEGHGVQPLSDLLHGPRPLGVVKLTPTHLAALSHGASSGPAPAPSALVVGGEALRAALVELWRRHEAPLVIVNEYGPTETTVGSVAHRVDAAATDSGQVPIGRPIANTRAHVLTDDLTLAPRGAIGELHIGGAGLGHGYVGEARLTAARFIPDPFSDIPGARLYRTGDLVRDLGGGVLEFRGRRDEQLKIRGFRIELGEVELALRRLEGVREAVVIGRELAQRSELCAYLVLDGRARPLSALQRELRRWLTDAMMPAHFVVLDAIPRLPSGKLDRAALPLPRPAASAEAPPPANAVESALARVWARVLELDEVGPHDNFFELGGDSILSVHVVAELRHEGLHMLLTDLFRYPTIAELAPRVRLEVAVDATATPADALLPLLPMQRWWLRQRPAEPDHFNQSLLLAVPGDSDPDHLERGLQALVDRHEALRVSFQRDGEAWTQRLPGAPPRLTLERVDLGAVPADARPAAMHEHATRCQRGMAIARGELVRAMLFTGGDEGPRVLLCLHHLAADAATWSVLLGDLARLWSEPGPQPARPLPPASLTPWAWAALLQAQVEAGACEPARALESRWAGLPLATPPAPASPEPDGTLERGPAGATSRSLLVEVPAAYPVRVDELVLAALALALAQATGRAAVLLDHEVHGREDLGTDADFSRAVGWFAAIAPVLVNTELEPAQLLAELRSALRGAPLGGIGHLALREFADLPGRQAPILCNHLGRLDGDAGPGGAGVLRVVDGPRGLEQSPRNRLPYALVVDSFIVGGELRLRWRWRGDLAAAAWVEQLVAGFDAALARLAAHCLSGAGPAYRPADFELADLDQGALDRIVAGLAGGATS